MQYLISYYLHDAIGMSPSSVRSNRVLLSARIIHADVILPSYEVMQNVSLHSLTNASTAAVASAVVSMLFRSSSILLRSLLPLAIIIDY